MGRVGEREPRWSLSFVRRAESSLQRVGSFARASGRDRSSDWATRSTSCSLFATRLEGAQCADGPALSAAPPV